MTQKAPCVKTAGKTPGFDRRIILSYRNHPVMNNLPVMANAVDPSDNGSAPLWPCDISIRQKDLPYTEKEGESPTDIRMTTQQASGVIWFYKYSVLSVAATITQRPRWPAINPTL